MQGEKLVPILCKAAIAYEPKKPMVIEQIWVAPPKAHEVRIKVISNALCHTDIYTLDGHDSQGLFPCILGHEATAIVQSIGEGVTRVKVGDVIIPCYIPECRQKSCIFCSSNKSNHCPKVRDTQGKGLMPDGTSRFTNKEGKVLYHFMGTSTFSQYSVISQYSAAKINQNADLNKVCMLGCGVSTGWGAAMNNTKVQPGSTVAVWGLGAVGLAVVQAAKIQGAGKIFAIDINQKKFEVAKKFGADVCFKPTSQKSGKAFLMQNQKWGINYTYDCTGHTQIMRQALESSHRGFGQSCVIGVAAAGKDISTRSFQLVTGRKWLGTAFGGWKSVSDVPKLVNKATLGEWPIDDYITHQFDGIQKVNDSVDALHSGDCLRAVIKISPPPVIQKVQIKVTSSVKLQQGCLKTVSHWSNTTNCFMTFCIYLPDVQIKHQRGNPYSAIYCLAGLSGNHQGWSQKSGFAKLAQKHKFAFIFPDTSPRNTNIPGIAQDWQVGDSAGYYVDATTDQYKKNFQMFSYINKELPDLVSTFFPVSRTNISITGFSMGGHGAIISGFKTGQFRSVSAFAPMANPTKCHNWGMKAFNKYFVNPQQQGKQYDATELLKANKACKVPLFVDLGSADQFADKLISKNLQDQLNESKYEHIYKIRPGYNHSILGFVATFLQEHIQFHAKYLHWYE